MMVVDKYTAEIQQIMSDFGAQVVGKTEQEILELQRKENVALMECLKRQAREMAWRAGEPIEPIVHEGAAVIVGKIGGAML